MDTSIIIPWLKENYDNPEIIAVSGNVGQADELEGLEEKAIKTGASKLYIEDTKDCIILFDEPELSLSIKWQSKFLPDIMHSEKCSALIAVTHSPFIFDNEFDNLARDMGACLIDRN